MFVIDEKQHMLECVTNIFYLFITRSNFFLRTTYIQIM